MEKDWSFGHLGGLKGEIVSITSLFFFFENIMQERYLKW
jgi:hypothetical protein